MSVVSVPAAEERAGALPALPQGVVGGVARGPRERHHIRGAGAHIPHDRHRRDAGHALGGQEPRRRHLRRVRRSIPPCIPPRKSSRLLLRDESKYDRGTHVN